MYLDVRSQLENEEVGKVKGSVNIEYMNCKWKYNAEERKKEIVRVSSGFDHLQGGKRRRLGDGGVLNTRRRLLRPIGACASIREVLCCPLVLISASLLPAPARPCCC